MYQLLAVALLGLFLTSCAHHRDVRAGASGVHRVVIETDNDDEGTRDAISQANHFCKEMKGGKSAAFVDETKKYTGDMSEEDYKKTKKIGKAAQIAGGTVWTMGGKRESTAGGIVGLGGAVADSVAGKGYTVEMKFKCE